MKNLLLLIAFVLMNFTTYSQDSTLTPDKVIIQGKDTLFAWSLVKCRSMAKSLIRLSYCDSTTCLQQEQIATLDSAISVQAKFIEVLNEQQKNQASMIKLKQREVRNLETENLILNLELYKQKRLKIVGFGLAGLLGLIAIVR